MTSPVSRSLAVVAVLTVLASGCGGNGETQATTVTDIPTTIASTTTVAPGLSLATVGNDLEFELRSWIAEQDVAGAVLAVSAPGQDVLVLPVGIANRDSGTPIEFDDYFRIGSTTKMATATVLLQLQEEGRVDLDMPLTELLPVWAERNFEAGSIITPRMLLNHTTGIRDYATDPDFIGLALARLTKAFEPDEIIDFALDKGLLFEPGTQYAYGTTDYLLAGQLIEQITGNAAHDELTLRVFEPLGMTNTFLPPAQQPPEPVVSGYFDLSGAGEEGTDIMALPQAALQSAGWTGGGLESQASDVIKLLPGLVDGGVLTQNSLAEMADPVFATDYGLGVNVGAIAGHSAWFHGGGVPGFRTAHAYFPDSGVSIGLVSNSTRADVWAYIERAVKLILG